ncbi:MAG: type III-B CRISPR module RAMP protein Cmr1, partial [Halothiobacillaceae bacterium]
TPLWTGGVDGTCDRLHETGLIGSLRWWYEAIIRGLGGEACDPTEHACSFDADEYKKAADQPERERLRAAGLCDACQLFGATGWRRRFRLQISAQDRPAWDGERSLNVRPYGRNRGWFLNAGRIGAVTLTCAGDEGTLVQMMALLRFLEMWGSLGPRPQLGYGVFHITEVEGTPQLGSLVPFGDAPIGGLPDLRAFTFFKLRFTPREATWWTQVSGLRELRGRREWPSVEALAASGMVPVTPALKNYLRFEQQWSSVSPHWLFGTLRGNERVRSKVALSWAYRLPDTDEWEIRGWVHLPNDARGRAAQAEVVKVLNQALAKPQDWEKALGLSAGFHSAAITYAPSSAPWQRASQQEIAAFLNSLQAEAIQ